MQTFITFHTGDFTELDILLFLFNMLLFSINVKLFHRNNVIH